MEASGSDALSKFAPYEMQEQLLEIIGPNGFFVEAGANDGLEQSNTYWLERFHGWRGVLVEAIPALYRNAAAERPDAQVFNCGLVSSSYDEPTITLRYAGLMSLVPGSRGSAEADDEWVEMGTKLRWEKPYEVAVPARTLTSVLEEAGAPRPDLLSLDVEGYELEVLRGLDFERFGPRYLLLEIRRDDMREPLDVLLGEYYEVVRELSPFDALYRLRADPAAASA
ncbi:MAG TPA: FkbM family methyltransferase [Solirubrobacteraceae bacterium]|nr:FkbM family methyltransferase [Solirubrobacteraceae bacterium]